MFGYFLIRLFRVSGGALIITNTLFNILVIVPLLQFVWISIHREGQKWCLHNGIWSYLQKTSRPKWFQLELKENETEPCFKYKKIKVILFRRFYWLIHIFTISLADKNRCSDWFRIFILVALRRDVCRQMITQIQ